MEGILSGMKTSERAGWRGERAKERGQRLPEWQSVFARACVCKGKTQLTHPHDRLFITQGTAQFLSYYEWMASPRGWNVA